MFAETLRFFPGDLDLNRVAITCDPGDGNWVDMSYRELLDIIAAVGRTLQDNGVQKGDRIVLVGENHYKWLPMFLGITGYGAVVVPVDGTSADQRVLHVIDDCQPRIVMVSRKYQSRYRELLVKSQATCSLINFHFDLLSAAQTVTPLKEAPNPPVAEDIAAIIYTSGTTGAPKGAMLSHRALLAAVTMGTAMGSYTADDIMLALLPFTHVFGLVDAGLLPLANHSRIVLPATYNATELLQAILNYRVTFVLVVPRLADLFAMALRQIRLPALKLSMIIGGAPVRPDTIAELRSRGLKTLQGFGMTETCAGVIMAEDSPIESVGRAPASVQVKLHEAKDGVGELLLKSPSLLSGYWRQPHRNAEIFDAEGFLRTGDLASFDQSGNVYIRGRLKDVIIPTGGQNVYPDELEMRLGTLPFAEEFAVFGWHENGVEIPALVVKMREETFPASATAAATAATAPVTTAAMPKSHVEAEIARLTADWPDWEKIRRIMFVPGALPRSDSLKIRRNILQTWLEERKSAEDAADQGLVTGSIPLPTAGTSTTAVLAPTSTMDWPGSDSAWKTADSGLFERFRDVVARFLNVPVEEVRLDRPLNDFIQLDSLGVIALMAHLEQVLRISMKDCMGEPVADFCTLMRLVQERGANLAKIQETEASLDFPPQLDFSKNAMEARKHFLQARMTAPQTMHAIACPEQSESLIGNIESVVGLATLPLGVAGPLRVNGEHARGEFFLPLATTEGALVASVTRGCQVITAAGGADVRILADSLVRAPIFVFDGIAHMLDFVTWIKKSFDMLKESAESTTRHGKLLAIEPFVLGSSVVLRFEYSTGDASGQNMTTIATHRAIQKILDTYSGPLRDWFLESNLSGDKKVNGVNFTRNRGKRLVAEVEIPADIVGRFLHTSPQRVARLGQLSMLTAAHAHSFGSQAHYANLLAALFIATGQDPACVAESATGVTNFEVRGGNLVVSVSMPGLMVGTVGGGTRLPTQRACLEILDCFGPGKAPKFAEIVAAGILAGEISLAGAMAADEFARAHAEYGRSKKAETCG